MARIPCPECKRQISETADSCPKCGYKLTPEEAAKIKKRQQDYYIGCSIAAVVVVLLPFIVVLIGKNSNTSSRQRNSPSTSTYRTTQNATVRIDVDNLANRSSSFVDNVLGMSPEITPITKYPSMMPGEFRYYEFSDGSSANIQFYKGQAKLFQMTVSTPEYSPQRLARRFGFDIGELGGIKNTPASTIWTRVHTQNARYKRVMAVKNSAGKYSVFQAEAY